MVSNRWDENILINKNDLSDKKITNSKTDANHKQLINDFSFRGIKGTNDIRIYGLIPIMTNVNVTIFCDYRNGQGGLLLKLVDDQLNFLNVGNGNNNTDYT